MSKPIRRVLFMTHKLNLTGVTTHLITLGTALIEQGIHVGVATRQTNDDAPQGRHYYEKNGLEVIPFDFGTYFLKWSNVTGYPARKRNFRKLIESFDPDVIHVHAPSLCSFTRPFSQRGQRAVVTTFHIPTTGKYKQKVARLAQRLWPRGIGQRAIAISTDMAEQIERDLGIDPNIIRRAPVTVDERQFQPATPEERRAAREAFGLGENDFVVANVATLTPRKNHKLLFDAVRIAKERGVPIKALCAGPGKEEFKAGLEESLRTLGIEDRVKLLGFVDTKPLYKAADVLVLPSFQEGFPLSVVEAMHSGLVPIRTPSEGARDQIIDGQTGFIVPFELADVLADRLVELATAPNRRSEMSQAARTFASENLTRAAMVEKILAVYRESLAEIAQK